MRPNRQITQGDTWDESACHALIEQLWSLRKGMLENEAALAPWLDGVDSGYRASARNLAHYLALRHIDRRPLQEKLARIGASSLGRSESNVLANVDKVLGILHRLTGQPWQPHSQDEPVGIQSSRKLLERHTTELLGAQQGAVYYRCDAHPRRHSAPHAVAPGKEKSPAARLARLGNGKGSADGGQYQGGL